MFFLAFRPHTGLNTTPSLPSAHSMNGHSTAYFPQLKQPFFLTYNSMLSQNLFLNTAVILCDLFSVPPKVTEAERVHLLLITSCDFAFSHHGFYYGYFDLLSVVLWDCVHIRDNFFVGSGSKTAPYHIKPLLYFLLLHYSVT